MKNLGALAAAATIAAFSLTSSALAKSGDAVDAFYAFLSNPGSQTHAEAFQAGVSDDWRSIGDYSGKTKSAGAFVGQLGFFAKLIPDLNWEIVERIEAGDRVTIRGRATGTPNGPLFGVDGQGRSFEIMSIDIHTLKDGKIVETYHVEDWAGALGQLKGK